MKHSTSAGMARHARQRGVVLVVTLIVLVAMTLAGIALLRSVDTSTVIAGNLSFKQSAVASGDAGVETAIAWLTANTANLQQDIPGSGYYATSQDALDLTGNKPGGGTEDDLDWGDADAVRTLERDDAGNQVAYIIHRMCDSAGPLNGATCATEQTFRGGSSQGASRQMLTYQPGAWESVANRGYYRITARVSGPRNTTSYIQVVVSI